MSLVMYSAYMGEGLCIGFHFELAATQEQAIKADAGYFEENLKMFLDSQMTRQLIRLRLQDGRRPHDRAVEPGFGPGR